MLYYYVWNKDISIITGLSNMCTVEKNINRGIPSSYIEQYLSQLRKTLGRSMNEFKN